MPAKLIPQPPTGTPPASRMWLIYKRTTDMEFAPHQQRVIDERRDLTEKLHKLILFFDTPIFRNDLEEAERVRLREQKMFMTIYRDILTERINAFIRAANG